MLVVKLAISQLSIDLLS